MVPRQPIITGIIFTFLAFHKSFISFARGIYLLTFSAYFFDTLVSHGTEKSTMYTCESILSKKIKSGLLAAHFYMFFWGNANKVCVWPTQ